MIEEVYEFLQKLVMPLFFRCPDCKQPLDHITICGAKHAHCGKCGCMLADLPEDIWAICMAHEATDFHNKPPSQEPYLQ